MAVKLGCTKCLYLLFFSMLIGNDLFAMQNKFSVQAKSFENGNDIPKECGYSNKNRSPELVWKEAPAKTKSFAVIVLDQDSPSKQFVHWIIYNIPVSKSSLSANIDHDLVLDDGSLQGLNDFNNIGYDGPAPPLKERHSYIFTVYALDYNLPNIPGLTFRKIKDLMKDHILESAEITGYFEGGLYKTIPNLPVKGDRSDDPNEKNNHLDIVSQSKIS